MRSAYASFLLAFIIAALPSGSLATKRALMNRPLSESEFASDHYRGYFRVVDSQAASDIVLRSAPSKHSPAILRLSAGNVVSSEGVAMRGSDTTWLKVVFDRQVGWLEIERLRHAKPVTFPGTELAKAGFCSGYDPLWALTWNEADVRLSTFPGTTMLKVNPDTILSARGATSLVAASSARSVRAVFDGHPCAPAPQLGLVGMSGLVIVSGSGSERLLTGCCQATAQAFPN